jgi:hypothetical protein
VYIVCFRSVDRRVESELAENFQDHNFEDLEQQQVGLEGKCPCCILYLFFVSIYRNACQYFFVRIVGNPSVISFHILSLLSGLGRILVIFYVVLNLPSLGLTMRTS